MTPDEEWRPIIGYEGSYEASSLGRIRSVQRTLIDKQGRPNTKPGKVLRPDVNNSGYLSIKLFADNRARRLSVHKLVTGAFYGPRPEGLLIRHLNGDCRDNRVGNLRYGTPAENALDPKMHGPRVASRHDRRLAA